ncbi:hypothetical protein DPMN_050769 [Dreissena polymorpha]|uniref:Uncharacterized protein n=1 Tax=Dreissena polymorpha TaxID=45954 RepID=A0A9D4CI79_DREPO|nr:hypothetical protein DPMN_050769 [Dreissena polymorpha]
MQESKSGKPYRKRLLKSEPYKRCSLACAKNMLSLEPDKRRRWALLPLLKFGCMLCRRIMRKRNRLRQHVMTSLSKKKVQF